MRSLARLESRCRETDVGVVRHTRFKKVAKLCARLCAPLRILSSDLRSSSARWMASERVSYNRMAQRHGVRCYTVVARHYRQQLW